MEKYKINETILIVKKKKERIILNKENVQILYQMKKNNIYNSECPVCFSILNDNTIVLLCNHGVCNDCLLEWRKQKNLCPICKFRIEF
jgi:hypothetical protein